MKKILLSTAALAGLAIVAAAPARAEEPALKLGVGGYISGYAIYTDYDKPSAVSTTKYRRFDFRKDTEVHLNGEVALDNGITAGAHLELLMDRADNGAGNDTTVEESYLYLSSSWGRVNFGEEDGIAYLIQVAPPSADDKIDGARPDISTIRATGGQISYAQDPFGYTNKFTYITPVFNGFQAGFSYTPSANEGDQDARAAVAASSGAGATNWDSGYEVAARYEGSFDAIDLAIGAGYSTATQELPTTTTEDLQDWNVAANIGYGAFGFGVTYVNFDETGAKDSVTDGWVFGADYVTGPYKLGLSYVNLDAENGTGTQDTNVDRYTAGAIYEWGPGMTFRGSVQYQEADDIGGATANDQDTTQIAIGTQLNF